ncbi:hypothetical protein KVV02_001181 [Mortierella alpina]|uniref:Uncharacterized protein n=1 Tax=Mortierella alpina TaxID=64518 RepID=A0A9P8A0X0_MORAP|nr:hypothetical protein KVV02_001181 [Mortierella alpina]
MVIVSPPPLDTSHRTCLPAYYCPQGTLKPWPVAYSCSCLSLSISISVCVYMCCVRESHSLTPIVYSSRK